MVRYEWTYSYKILDCGNGIKKIIYDGDYPNLILRRIETEESPESEA